MMSYTSFLIQPFIDLLKSFETSDSEEDALWLALLSTLTKSLQYDEGGANRVCILSFRGTDVPV